MNDLSDVVLPTSDAIEARMVVVAFDRALLSAGVTGIAYRVALTLKGASGRYRALLRAIHDAMDGLYVRKNDLLTVKVSDRLEGARIANVVPNGPALVVPSTTVKVFVADETVFPVRSVSYSDVGGLETEIARIREIVELPLLHPDLMNHLGIEAPKGVLLHGPPGCGKTLIARAVAHEAGCYFISINGPEVIQQHYGESEAFLRKVFEDAREHAPSIIFLDELDAIAPSRDAVLGDVEKRVVAQLLTLMDGLHNRGKVIVMAATNLPNNIDPALRRPGRFDREIGINPPNKLGRLEILKIHTRSMPLGDDVQLSELAAQTHGFLGADLAALCKEAAMLCGREVLRFDRPSSVDSTPPPGAYADSKVSMRHFEMAKGLVDLSTTRSFFSETIDVGWHAVGGLKKARETLRDAVELPLRYGERFNQVGIRPPKGVLLKGPPGTGKTLIAHAVGAESGVNFIAIKGPEVLSKWVGESEKAVRDVFKKARQAAPAIIFFDEFDAIARIRGNNEGGGNVGDRIVGALLLEMDSLQAVKDVVVLAATNRPELLDVALLRPGRFDFVVELDSPDVDARLDILKIHVRNVPMVQGVDLREIADRAGSLTGAELAAVCQRAALFAVRESIASHPNDGPAPIAVSAEHFHRALQSVKQTSVRTN